ncbi:hypothetical protein GCM10009785_00050 [Brooklawnia cerclae]|uniref:Uncharacterized protein n=1 Tax=Brooklawnia cerclae TaxID=349934 RepID=A0ABX0SKF6_9ACTN|nr:hypothetical protein [Brooklawnia cerclae]NIH58486.1 hypothetical protein [Brooklawnia cerclae]
MSQCAATSKQSGERCKNHAIPGATVCRIHGGAAPAVMAKARQRVLLAQAERDVTAFGGRLDVTAPEALLELVQTKAAEVAYWDQRVSLLDDDERAGLLVAQTDRGSGPMGPVDTTTSKTGPHVFVAMLHKAQDQLAAYAAAAIRAGVDEAMVQIATMQAAWLIPHSLRVARLARLHPDADEQTIVRMAIEDGRQG